MKETEAQSASETVSGIARFESGSVWDQNRSSFYSSALSPKSKDINFVQTYTHFLYFLHSTKGF